VPLDEGASAATAGAVNVTVSRRQKLIMADQFAYSTRAVRVPRRPRRGAWGLGQEEFHFASGW